MKRSPPPPSPSPPLCSPSSPSSSSSNSSSNSTPCKGGRIHKGTKAKAKNSKKVTSQNKEANSPNGSAKRSSIHRGVTRHRWTGRFEAHLWDKNCFNSIQNKKGRQVYLGAYDTEEAAAHAYDLAALKYWGPETILNFPLEVYGKEMEEMQGVSKEEYLTCLRRRSSGFSRGVSKYRGVARHHHNGRWEARIGRVFGNKYLYLGTFSTQEEAAQAYDLAAIEYRGANAVTNFDISCYLNQPQLLSQLQQEPLQAMPALQEQPQYEQSESTIQEPKSNATETPGISGDADKPTAVDGNIEESLWSPCMDYEFETYAVTGASISESTDLSEWFNDAAFEDNIECLFEGCYEMEEGNKDGAGVTEIGLVAEVEKPKEDVSDGEGITSQVKNVSYPPTMISVCTVSEDVLWHLSSV